MFRKPRVLETIAGGLTEAGKDARWEKLLNLALSRGIAPKGSLEDFLSALAADLARELELPGFYSPPRVVKPKKGRPSVWPKAKTSELVDELDAIEASGACQSRAAACRHLAERSKKWRTFVQQVEHDGKGEISTNALAATLRSRDLRHRQETERSSAQARATILGEAMGFRTQLRRKGAKKRPTKG